MGKTKLRIALAALTAPLIAPFHATPASDDDFSRERHRMVAEIAAMAKATKRETGRERFTDHVMDAMAKVPRHRFVAETSIRSAYRNAPLPIGEGQTISQPYIVALSTDLIDPRPENVVLEIGTGSGYQAAVLSELVKEVYSIEIVEPLGRAAAERRAVRRHHRHRRGALHSRPADRATEARRENGDPRRKRSRRPANAAGGEAPRRNDRKAGRAGCSLRTDDRKGHSRATALRRNAFARVSNEYERRNAGHHQP